MVSEKAELAEVILSRLSVVGQRLGGVDLGPMVKGVGSGGAMGGRGVARGRAPAVATSRGLIRVNPGSHHHRHRCNNKKVRLTRLFMGLEGNRKYK